MAAEAAALRTAAAALARQVFACVADAEAAHAIARKAAAPRWHAVTPTVVAETVIRRSRGRPHRDAPPPTTLQYRPHGSWTAPDPAAVQAERQRRGTLVLVTDDRERSARDLVPAYKGQTHAEQAFRWAKQPWHGDAFYLQNPERVAGLGFLLLLALPFVRAMRQLARAAFRDQPPWALPDGRRLRRPPTRSFSRNCARCGCAAVARRPTPGTRGAMWRRICSNSWRRSRCRSTSALNRGEPPTSFEK